MANSRKDPKGRVLRKGESFRNDGRYVYQYTDYTGKRRCFYSKDLVALREREKRVLRNQLDGVADYVSKKVSLNYVFDRYISTKYDLKEQTKVNYKYMYNHFVRDTFGKRPIAEIRYSDVKAFYISLLRDKGIRLNTLDNVHCVLHPVFDMAVRDDVIRKNPSDRIMAELKRSEEYAPNKRHALTAEQQKAFLDFTEMDPIYQRWYPVLVILFGTGMRIGECLGLRWDDIDYGDRTINVNHTLLYRPDAEGKLDYRISTPKTESGVRVIPMVDKVMEAFREEYDYQMKNGFNLDTVDDMTNFVFRNRFCNMLSPQSVNRAIKCIYEAYNAKEILDAAREKREPATIPHFTCHHIRHTFCTRLCESETNLKVIQDIMGHSDIKTTMDIYAEVSEKKKQEVMTALEKGNAIFQ